MKRLITICIKILYKHSNVDVTNKAVYFINLTI